jgi:transmembrane protein
MSAQRLPPRSVTRPIPDIDCQAPSSKTSTPALSNSAVQPIATSVVLRFLLCFAYAWNGVTKLMAFNAFNATAKQFSSRFQLPVPHAAVALTICVQLVGSAMFITGLGAAGAAIALALFAMAAIVIVYPFWTNAGVERARNTETFFEHVGLATAFLI